MGRVSLGVHLSTDVCSHSANPKVDEMKTSEMIN